MTAPARAFARVRRSLALPNHTPNDRIACPIGAHHRWCFEPKGDSFTGVHSEIAHLFMRAYSFRPSQVKRLSTDCTFGVSMVHAHDELGPIDAVAARVDGAVPPRVAICQRAGDIVIQAGPGARRCIERICVKAAVLYERHVP